MHADYALSEHLLGAAITIADTCLSPLELWHQRVYRPFGFVIPGTAGAAYEMARHFQHGQSLWQSDLQWLDIEVPEWPAC